jgi:hypothetical protein
MTGGTELMSYIVSGFHTPDYRDCVTRLIASLDALGEPHAFFDVAKHNGGWEANTMRKADYLTEAVRSYPDKTIIWLDVDCTVRRPLSGLAQVPGDVSTFFKVRRKPNSIRIGVVSCAVIIKPTRGGRDFVETWRRLTHYALPTDIDQTTMAQALGLCHGTAFSSLSPDWCWPDHPDGPLAFYSASEQKRLPKFKRPRRALTYIRARMTGHPIDIKQLRPLLCPKRV